eukprot:TRINITY_DN65593_c3_g2_i1.p2 TRINITY_DN65593_c3_g2~~TRINITY_DN65593_c3_g2_i1.p2  ORF type:complete len:156 (-),score=14.79 TRINITY_DN65593_c3_g2_i1:610-1077(-)
MEFQFSTTLKVSAETVWKHCTTIVGVNKELFPLVKMTAPSHISSLSKEDITLGSKICRSWILLLCCLPIDYDDVTLVEIDDEPGYHRFLEQSPMLSVKLWQHERIVQALPGGGCRVTDKLRFTPKLAALGWVQQWTFKLAFWLRHKNLAHMFNRN